MWISGEKRIQVDGILKKKTKREFFHNQTTPSEEATLWLSLITSITVAFAFIFSFVGGWVTERFKKKKAPNFTLFHDFGRYGRKPAILVASVVFTVGSLVMAVSPSKEVRKT